MKSDNERIEAFLKGVVLPEYESDGHARQLRAQILSRLQAGRAGRGTSSWWKTAALLLGLLGAAALATETIIQVRHYYFYGRGVTICEPDPELPGPVPLTFKQEVELVRLAVLEKKGEFLGSTQVRVLGRTFSLQQYSFTLSDGTVVTRSEGQPEGPKNNLTAAEGDEVRQLAAANKGETLGTYDEDVNGKPFKFTRVKYVLSDGTEVIQSTGKPDGER